MSQPFFLFFCCCSVVLFVTDQAEVAAWRCCFFPFLAPRSVTFLLNQHISRGSHSPVACTLIISRLCLALSKCQNQLWPPPILSASPIPSLGGRQRLSIPSPYRCHLLPIMQHLCASPPVLLRTVLQLPL